MKRLFDFFVALVGVIVLSPFFLLIALWVAADSRGGIFYLQERIGKDEIPFRLFKFRTMRVATEKQTAITIGERDPRITTAGYWLRKLKLDELPQLLNVLKGDMSLVGPRPEVFQFTSLYSAEQKKVFSVRPGITDPASIKFRNENALLDGKADPVKYYIDSIMPEKIAINLIYIRDQSFWGDIGILFRTLFTVIKS